MPENYETMAARIATLEAQVAATQRANTRLIAQVVELEHERDRALAAARHVQDALQQAARDMIAVKDDRDATLKIVACAVSLVSYARGMADQMPPLDASNFVTGGHYRALAAAVDAWDAASLPPRQPALTAAPGRCDHCGLPLVSAHVADEVIVANGERRAHVHRVCADYLRGQGW